MTATQLRMLAVWVTPDVVKGLSDLSLKSGRPLSDLQVRFLEEGLDVLACHPPASPPEMEGANHGGVPQEIMVPPELAERIMVLRSQRSWPQSLVVDWCLARGLAHAKIEHLTEPLGQPPENPLGPHPMFCAVPLG